MLFIWISLNVFVLYFCNILFSSLTAVCCFDNGYVGKQTVAWKEYYAEYWLKEL